MTFSPDCPKSSKLGLRELLGTEGATGGAGRLRMIRRPPRRATTDPVVTPCGAPRWVCPWFWGSQGAGRGLACASRGSVGMLLLALILPGWLSQGMPPARGMSPARGGCGQQRSLHPLSPVVGTGLPEQPGWKGALWGSASPPRGPHLPGVGVRAGPGVPGAA